MSSPDNFFTGNPDLQFHFAHAGLAELSSLSPPPGDGVVALSAYRGKLEELGRLAATEIAPRATAADRAGSADTDDGRVRLPEATKASLEALRQAGLMGVTLPRQYGGLDFPQTVHMMMNEMVSRADAALQNLFGLQTIGETILHFGSEEQKNRLLPPLAAGEWDSAMVLTEPGAGSDLQAVQTTATQEADGTWRLDGFKHFITNGTADLLLVLARSEAGSRDGRGLSLFLARPCPQITATCLQGKLGLHASPTCELHFDHAPAELIGQRRLGLVRYVMSMMNGARLAISAQAVGIAEAARAIAAEYCRQRRQFGKPIAELPAVWEMLSRMDALTAAGRALLYRTCRHVDLREAYAQRARRTGSPEDAALSKRHGRLADVLTPMTKAFAAAVASQCADDGIQCLGGRGYMRGFQLERLYRDARVTSIYEGTTQLQVVAATAGILRNGLDELFAELDQQCVQAGVEATGALTEVHAIRRQLLEALPALAAEPRQMELRSRHLVRAMTILLAAQLLLLEGAAETARRATAERFCWEFLPEAQMHAAMLSRPLPE